jgi:hypothetical protein
MSMYMRTSRRGNGDGCWTADVENGSDKYVTGGIGRSKRNIYIHIHTMSLCQERTVRAREADGRNEEQGGEGTEGTRKERKERVCGRSTGDDGNDQQKREKSKSHTGIKDG